MYTYNSTYSAAPIVRGMILFKEICYLQRIVQIVLVSNIIGAKFWGKSWFPNDGAITVIVKKNSTSNILLCFSLI